MSTASGTTLITDDQALHELLGHLSQQPWIAVDTEFEREKTFYARLCLVQVATPARVACIDPLELADFDALAAVMSDRAVLKVLHACSQDMEVLFQRWGSVPAPVFDTQVAAPLLGYADQIGYAGLVEKLLDVHLPKAHTRADWCARPLSSAQLDYAADDVRYLAQLYPALRERLREYGRLDWLAQDFAALSEPALYTTEPGDAWRRLRGLDRLDQRSLAIAQELAAWREQTARRADRPRAWILRDAQLLELARAAPADAAALASLELPERLRARHGEELLRRVAAARATTPVPAPAGRPAPLSEPESSQLQQLLALVRQEAERLGVDATVLASRKRLVRLIRGEAPAAVLAGWRGHALGAALEKALG